MYLHQSLPRLGGEIPVAGIGAAVEILRDGYGVPHIFAQSERDAHFALGFVHAQDRLWPWSRGQYIRTVTDRKQLEANGVQRPVLTPMER